MKNNFKFYKDLKGIEFVLVPCAIIILNKLNKTVKAYIFINVIAEISTPLQHYYTIFLK